MSISYHGLPSLAVHAAFGQRPPRPARQRGVVLFTSLVLLVILTLVGVMLSRLQSVEERISQNDQDHQMAVQAAEATLRFAEIGLENGGPGYTCFACNNNGLYTWESGTPDAYRTYNLSSPAGQFIAYGGAALPVVGVPKFLIEKMPAVAMVGSSVSTCVYGCATPPTEVYRITAYSYGGDTSATAELQEIDWQ